LDGLCIYHNQMVVVCMGHLTPLIAKETEHAPQTWVQPIEVMYNGLCFLEVITAMTRS